MKLNEIRKSKYASFFLSFVCLLMIIGLSVYYFLFLRSSETAVTHTGEHLLLLIPENANDIQNLQEASGRISDDWNIRLETMPLATIALQKEMLSIVPDSDIEGVLFWPISNAESDYSAELNRCRLNGIPVVLLDHDFSNKALRNSYVGSGIASELLVLNDTLYTVADPELPIVIGCYSHSDSSVSCELLVLEPGESSRIDPHLIENERLRAYVYAPPHGFCVSERHILRDDGGSSIDLKFRLMNLLRSMSPSCIFFSLDETMTTTVADALDSNLIEHSHIGKLIGYGQSAALSQYLGRGIVDELIVSDNAYSAEIGLKYLHDILQNLWVPSSMDSGIRIIKYQGDE